MLVAFILLLIVECRKIVWVQQIAFTVMREVYHELIPLPMYFDASSAVMTHDLQTHQMVA